MTEKKGLWDQGSLFREWVETIVVALLLALFIRAFFFQAFKIPSGSMRMTLIEGDRLIVNKLRYGAKVPFTDKRLPGYSTLQRGDIIVFDFPGDDNRDFIKRLIGLEGDVVEIISGEIYVNGEELDHPVTSALIYYNQGHYGKMNTPIEVPAGHVYVLGDNSASSHDSRYWGFVPVENIIGRAEFIYWPPKRIRWLK